MEWQEAILQVSSCVASIVLTCGTCLLSCWCRGYRILTAIMEDLNLNRNLKQATDVVLTGCSGQPPYHVYNRTK